MCPRFCFYSLRYLLLHLFVQESPFTTNPNTVFVMHFTKLLTSVFLAALASTSPLVSQHASLSKRLVESGEQAGAYLDAPQGVKLNIVHGGRTYPKTPFSADPNF